jgi:hypothetical protein
MTTPEARARRNIDALLADCGWVVQDRSALNLHAGRGVAVPNHFNGIVIIDDESTLTDGANVEADVRGNAGTDVGAIHELPLRESPKSLSPHGLTGLLPLRESIQSLPPGESPGQLPLRESLP